MKLPSLDEIGHWWRVAKRFPIHTQEFWVGLLHDTVEDGYLPKWLLRWPALDAMTRRDGESYEAFIHRAKVNPVSRRVKLSDLHDNLTRNGGPPRKSLLDRYIAAQKELEKAND